MHTGRAVDLAGRFDVALQRRVMRAIDHCLRRWRMRMAHRYIRSGDRLLDIGCHDGSFIESVRTRVSRAVGIDPLATPAEGGTVTILRGQVPGDPRLRPESFDCVTMLATLEHVADPAAVSRDCFRLLTPGGRFILTVPHAIAHQLVHVMVWLGMSDSMGVEAGRDFDVGATPPLLSEAGFRILERRTFELGLNHLYVAEKPAGSFAAETPRR